MSTAPDHRRMSRDEYLAFERASETKHEFLENEVFAMAGASRRHALIITNLTRRLAEQLDDSKCEVYPNDMRVRVSPTGLYTYPDIVIACDDPKFEDKQVDTLLTPTVLIEVLSDSTKDYDRGDKWKHYRQIESLQHYLLVAQDAMEIEQYSRQDDGNWLYSDHRPDHEVDIQCIGCRLKWDEVYARVEFESPKLEQPK
jgi:Uma2 family endonuclease